MAHKGIYQNASARNTHFNDDNHLQNDAYPFYFFFFFRTFKITLKCDPGKFPGYTDGVTEVYTPLTSEYVRTMVLQLYLPYFYFQSKENDSFSFHILSCFRLCFGQMFFQHNDTGICSWLFEYCLWLKRPFKRRNTFTPKVFSKLKSEKNLKFHFVKHWK